MAGGITEPFHTGTVVGLVRPFQNRVLMPGRANTGTPDRQNPDTVTFTWGKSPTQIQVVQNHWSFSVKLYMTKRQVEEETDSESGEEFVEGG
jgi:hypothetical protein